MNHKKTDHSLLRRLTAGLLAAALSLSLALPAVAAADDGGVVYLNSVSDLLALAQHCSYDQWSKGKTVVLQQDLSLEGVDWEPIPSFSGSFQGNGHTIRDMEVSGAYAPAGFFGTIEQGGSVQGLTVKGRVAPSGTQSAAGGLAGINHGVITRCQFSGVVECETQAGGLVGCNETTGTIDHGTAWAVVSGGCEVGGIAGCNKGVITGCTNLGAVNAEYRESALDMEGMSAVLLESLRQRMGDDLNGSISNSASDTGGIAGHSSGLILSSVNQGAVGYAHVGYNVGGIVGRTDGLVSGCVNQGTVQGRKDVGGIAGQAEPYIALDLDESTLQRLRTEMDTLHTLVNSAADGLDASAHFIDRELTALNTQMSAAVDAARRLEAQGGDYFDEVADEVDRTGQLISDSITRLEPVLDTGTDALEQLTSAVGQMKWVTAEMAAELLTASAAMAKFSSGLDATSDALDAAKQGFQQIEKGLDDLLGSIAIGSDERLAKAISTITGGYSLLPADSADTTMQTALSLLQIANTAMNVLSVGSGVSTEMKLLTTGLGLARSALLLSNDQSLLAASRQVSQAVGSIAAVTAQVGGLVGSTAKLVANNGNAQWSKSLGSISDVLDKLSGHLETLDQLLRDFNFDKNQFGTGTDAIQSGLASLSSVSGELSSAAKDFSASLEILKTDAVLTSATVGQLSLALGQMQQGMGGLTDMTRQAADIVQWLSEQDPIHLLRPSEEMSQTTDQLFDAVGSMTDQMSSLNSALSGASGQVTGDLRAVNDQINVVAELLLDAVEEISEPGSKTILADESRQLTDRNEGKLEDCTNWGSVEADMNVGGVAGTMGIENTLDPEDDETWSSQSLLRTEYAVSAVVLGCVNAGAVTAKKDAVGGIVGEMDLGYVSGCESYGAVEGTSAVGGIAGVSSAAIAQSWAKCALTGEKYVGGILGRGGESRLTGAGCTVTDCRSMVQITPSEENAQYLGAIAGGQSGTFAGNLFVSDNLRGVDRVSRTGQAEPTDYETLRTLDGAPTGFQSLMLRFVADGHVVEQRSFAYGDSFTQDSYPELPQKDGYFARWSTPVLDELHLDTVVLAEYTPYLTALASAAVRENGRPVFFVEGLFGSTNALQADEQTPDGTLAGASEQWVLEFSDDGQASHTVRYRTKGEGSIYVRQADGSWQRAETQSFGSYQTFEVQGTRVTVAFRPDAMPMWAVALGGAAVAAAVVVLLRVRKKRYKKAAPAQQTST